MKKKQVKQIRTKSGQIRFYQDGKRISEKKATPLLKQQIQQRSKKAKESSKDILYYKGKPLTKAESYLVSLALKDAIKKERRLDKLVRKDGQKVFKNKAELNRLVRQQADDIKDFFQTENAWANLKSGKVKGDRITKRGSMDVGEFLQKGAFSKYKVTLLTENSQIIQGKVNVMNYLWQFEARIMAMIIDADKNKGTQVTFDYTFEVSTNLKTLIIHLTSDSDISIKEEIKEAVKKDINIIKYFQDVTIRIGYS